MGKFQELKRMTFAMGALSLLLFGVNIHSLYDIETVAKTTISRIPASLTQGIGAPLNANEQVPSLERVSLDCSQILKHESLRLTVKSRKIQMQFSNCGEQKPMELVNLTNGYQSTLFDSFSGTLSDLISLSQGTNKIHVRLEKTPSPIQIELTF
ncbi:hypothetical protein GW916_06115 [bacterium]|nr:hypothetical protein [bacterium]